MCAPTQAEAEALAGERVSARDEEDFGFVGTPAQVIDQMRRFVALGVTYFALDCADFPARTTIESLIRQVLPALTG